MGLYNHLNDVSSDSIPLLLVAIVANCVSYLRSSLHAFLHLMGFSFSISSSSSSSSPTSSGFDSVNMGASVGSGLTGLIVLAEQLNVNIRVFKYGSGCDGCGGGGGCNGDCVVCLCRLGEGEEVRKLGCGHVFHKECLDGWLFDHFNLTCPLCRSPLVSQDRVAATQTRVSRDLLTWFSMR